VPKDRVPGGETPEDRVHRLERENAKLRKQVERLEEDRAILKKAAAFFAKESE
jgi:transposase